MELMDRFINQLEEERVKLRNLPVWTKEDYINQRYDLCIESHDGFLITNIEDYFCLPCMDVEDMKTQIQDACMIPVYTKTNVVFNGNCLLENYFLGIEYGLNINKEELDEINELFNQFANSLNEKQPYFVKKEQVAWLDLSKETEEYCLRELNLTTVACV